MFVNTTWLPERVGGAELHTLWVAQEMQRRGHEVSVVCGGPAASNSDSSGGEAEDYVEGVRSIRLMRASASGVYRWGAHPSVIAWARDSFRRERPDAVVFGLFWGLCGIAGVARELGIPYVIVNHLYSVFCRQGFQLQPGRVVCDGLARSDKCRRCELGVWSRRHRTLASLFQLLPDSLAARMASHAPAWRGVREADEVLGEGRRFAANAARLIAPTEFVAAELRKNGFDTTRIVHLPYGLPPGLLAEQDSGENSGLPAAFFERIDEKSKHVAVISRLSPEKGLETLIDAFVGLPRSVPLRLDLFGSGPSDYEALLKSLSSRDDRIRFHGAIANHQVRGVLQAIDYLAVPSNWKEVSGINAREALACGTPVLATSMGGLPEAVRHGTNGLLVNPDDPAALREALRRIAAGDAPGKPLAADVRGIFTIAEHVDGLERVLFSVC